MSFCLTVSQVILEMSLVFHFVAVNLLKSGVFLITFSKFPGNYFEKILLFFPLFGIFIVVL